MVRLALGATGPVDMTGRASTRRPVSLGQPALKRMLVTPLTETMPVSISRNPSCITAGERKKGESK